MGWGPGPGSGPGGAGWFPGDQRDDYDSSAPPPYSKRTTAPGDANASAWRPGFWTGAALAGASAALLNRNSNVRQQRQQASQSYDWERERERTSSYRQPTRVNEDRGEGSSNLGSMRQSTGMGGSNVR